MSVVDATRMPACVRDLLHMLRDPAHAATVPLARWEPVLRVARETRLLGVLEHRISAVPGLVDAVPKRVAGHLVAARHATAHHRQAFRMALAALDRALPPGLDVVVLKGAAYELGGSRAAGGRLPGDIDLMVARDDLERAESSLAAAGWISETTDAYDQRYYREWSHELPPLRHPGYAFEVDLHHAITPVTSRLQPSAALLREGLRALPGQRFRALHPLDQVIHAALHAFQDTDLADRLRDVVDIDAMLRERMSGDEDWRELLRRTAVHGMQRPVAYALRYARAWLGTPVPPAFALPEPPPAARAAVDWIVAGATLPPAPGSADGVSRRLARVAGTARYHWLRMPPSLLFPHLVRKQVRRLAKAKG